MKCNYCGWEGEGAIMHVAVEHKAEMIFTLILQDPELRKSILEIVFNHKDK